jgi:predicted kinase
MCGLPGSGKTTQAIRLSGELAAVRLCPDEWMAALEVDLFEQAFRDRLEIQFWELAQDLLRKDTSVILESGFWLRSDRDQKRLFARKHGIPVELRYFDVAIDELIRRVEVRNADPYWAGGHITPDAMRGYLRLFQPPDPAEIALYDPPSVL